MAITTQDGLDAALASAERKGFTRGSFTPRAVGAYHSLWKVAGLPGPGVTPATGNGAIPDDTTAGAHPFTNGAGAENNYLLHVAATSLTLGTLYFYDRLWANSGLNTTTTITNFTSTALTRHTGGVAVEVWLEVYTALGAATASNLTVSYTNQAGTTGRTGTIVKPAVTTAVGEMFPMQLQSGDSGVRAIASTQWSVTQTSGDFGLVMMKRCGMVPLRPSDQGASVLGPFDLPYAEIADDACIATMLRAGSASANSIDGELGIGKG
jgi:hypothetical protein